MLRDTILIASISLINWTHENIYVLPHSVGKKDLSNLGGVKDESVIYTRQNNINQWKSLAYVL